MTPNGTPLVNVTVGRVYQLPEIHQKLGVNGRAIRHWIKRKLVQALNTRDGHRLQFDAQEVERIGAIIMGQKIGMSLQNIQKHLPNADSTDLQLTPAECEVHIRHLEERKKEIEDALFYLQSKLLSHPELPSADEAMERFRKSGAKIEPFTND